MRAVPVILVATLGLICAGLLFDTLLLDVILAVIFGWVAFLGRVAGQLTVSSEGMLTGLVCLVLLSVGLHLFADWIYRNTNRSDEPRHWRLRWSFSIVGVVVLMFVAGIAVIGASHQTVWLITSPEPLFKRSFAAGPMSASQHNLKEQTLAVISYVDQEGDRNPLGVLMDPDGRMLHGWQAQVLPQMDNDSLYKKIDFTKPWDHPINRPAMSTELKRYQHMLIKEKVNETGYGLSHYAGNVHVLGYRMPPFPRGFPDGPAQTIMLGEVSTNLKPWGHPVGWRNFALGVQRSPDGFGGPIKGKTQVALGDGSVRTITDRVSLPTLKAASTPAGNDELGDDW